MGLGLGLNWSQNETRADIADASVAAGSLDVIAASRSLIYSGVISAGGAGTVSGVGAVNLNVSANRTAAVIGGVDMPGLGPDGYVATTPRAGAYDIRTTGRVRVAATDAARIAAASGAFNGAGTVSLAATIAANVSANAAFAGVSGGLAAIDGAAPALATVAAGSLDIQARTDSRIVALAGVGTGAGTFAGGGALPVNAVADKAFAYLGGGRVAATGAVTVDATSGAPTLPQPIARPDSPEASLRQLATLLGVYSIFPDPDGKKPDDAPLPLVNAPVLGLTAGSAQAFGDALKSLATFQPLPNIVAVSFGASGAGAVTVGAGVNLNVMRSQVSGVVEGGVVEAGSLLVQGRQGSTVASAAAGGGGAGTVAVQGSFSTTTVANRTIAEIRGGAQVTTRAAGPQPADGDVTVAALDSAAILGLSGRIVGAGTVAIGGAIVNNNTASVTSARIAEGSAVRAAGRVAVTGDQSGIIGSLSLFAGGASTVALSGSLALNVVNSQVLAAIEGGAGARTLVLANGADGDGAGVVVAARDRSIVVGLAGGLTVAPVAVSGGAAGGINAVSNRAAARVTGADVTATTGDVIVSATQQAYMGTGALAVGGVGRVAIYGTGVATATGNAVEALIGEGAAVATPGDIGVFARADNVLVAAGGSGGLAIGAVALGLTAGVVAQNDVVSARVEQATLSAGGRGPGLAVGDEVTGWTGTGANGQPDGSPEKRRAAGAASGVVVSARRDALTFGVVGAAGGAIVGLSGAAAFNVQANQTSARVVDSQIRTADGADPESGLVVQAVGVNRLIQASANLSAGLVGVGGSVLVGVDADLVSASVERSRVAVPGDVRIAANGATQATATAFGASVAPAFAFSPIASAVGLGRRTFAFAQDSDIAAGGSVRVEADDSSRVQVGIGQFAAGVAAAAFGVTVGAVANVTEARIAGGSTDAAGDLIVSAVSERKVTPVNAQLSVALFPSAGRRRSPWTPAARAPPSRRARTRRGSTSAGPAAT